MRAHLNATRTRGQAEIVRQGVPAAHEDGVAERMRLSRARIAGGQPVAGEETAAAEVTRAADQGSRSVVEARALRIRRRRVCAAARSVDIPGDVNEAGWGQATVRDDRAATLELHYPLVAIVEGGVGVPAQDEDIARIPGDVELRGDLETGRHVDDVGLRHPNRRIQAVERRGGDALVS